MEYFRTKLRKSKDLSVRGLSLAEVWFPDVTNHPVFSIWAASPGANRPIRAAVAEGCHFVFDRHRRDDTKWPHRDGPVMESRPVMRDGAVDHVQTVAYFRDLSDPVPPTPVEPGETVRFLVVPPSRLVVRDDGATGAAAARHLGIHVNDDWAGIWASYAALLALYLANRTRYPILPGATARALLLAAAVRFGALGWVGDGPKPVPFNTRQDVAGLADLGYATPMAFQCSDATLRKICRFVPGALARHYGTEFLRGDTTPPEFLRASPYQARAIQEEVESWLG